MAFDAVTYAAAKKYTDDSMAGAGAVAGVPCQVANKTVTDEKTTWDWKWQDNEGTEHLTPMEVKNGTDGQDGAPGQDGADGASPTVAVEEITGGHKVTITDKDGDHEFNVMDGEDGESSQASVMPEASESNEGVIVQYVGQSTASYINGYFYKCVENSGSYSWTQQNVQPGGSGGGAVDSVNGKTGTVILGADDVNAVGKEAGKGLSTNDYTNEDKLKLSTLDLTVSQMQVSVLGKVDKVEGKGLSTNDYDNAEKAEVAKVAGKADATDVVDGASYDSTNHLILFKHENTTLFSLDAAAFVKDGMVDTVTVTGGNLVITFNTDAGKQNISIPISDIFDADNYYTKTATDTLLTYKVDKVAGKGLSTNDYTDTEKLKLSTLDLTVSQLRVSVLGLETAVENVEKLIPSTATISNKLATMADVGGGGGGNIYGAEWDGTSSQAWTRTDAAVGLADPVPALSNGTGSSPFDNIAPWSEIKRVTDPTAGELVKIPKFWYKWTQENGHLKIQISQQPRAGFATSPAHADRGDGHGERDYIYVGRYHCAESTYKSTTGVKPMANKTRAQFRSSIAALGTGNSQCDIMTRITIWMLYIVEFAHWNSQAKIGYGCGNNTGTENMGSTDAMQYHTGTTEASRTTYGHTQYRYMEDLWGNVLDWCDGIYFSGADIYCIKNPASFSDTTGGKKVGTRPTVAGYIKSMKVSEVPGFEWFMYPDDCEGADADTYIGDYCGYGASGVVLRVGGGYNQGQDRGLFVLNGSGAASYAGASIGSRLQLLP